MKTTISMRAAVAVAASLALVAGGSVAAAAETTTASPAWTITNTTTGSAHVNVVASEDRRGAIPAATAYPDTVPAGYEWVFAGAPGSYDVFLLEGRNDATGTTAELVCLDFHRPVGYVGYTSTAWAETDARALGYAAQAVTLSDLFLSEAAVTAAKAEVDYDARQPQSAREDASDLRAVALQLAVWYFTDGVIAPPLGATADGVPARNVPNNDVVRTLVAGLVTAAQAAGPQTEPASPTLTIDPASARQDADRGAGPFTVTSNGTPVTVEVRHGQLFRDAALTDPIASGTAVETGTRVWVRADAGREATITATTAARLLSGAVGRTTGGFQDTMLVTPITVGTASATAVTTPHIPVLRPTG